MADAAHSKCVEGDLMGVRVPPSAPRFGAPACSCRNTSSSATCSSDTAAAGFQSVVVADAVQVVQLKGQRAVLPSGDAAHRARSAGALGHEALLQL
jgi:hypothetical protein